MRIAALNCYLQCGHTETAEIEATARLIEAARRMGFEAQAFARSEDILDYAPDLVLALSYQDAKLTRFPTYGLLTMPIAWVQGVPRFLRNILSYDGYWTIAPKVSEFVGSHYARAGKPNVCAFAALSVPRTDFVPLDFSRSWAAYVGTNWDGTRHGELFRVLAPLGVAKFYGKRERWVHVPAEAFGGEVPFDGVSVLNVYRHAGIGLCLNHPEFDAEGIPTSRVFETPAASAVVVAAQNPMVREAYGDAALYVDANGTPGRVADEIRDHVAWVRSHPDRAREMAEACHRIFNERFAMEAFLKSALALHQSACVKLGLGTRDQVDAAPKGAAARADKFDAAVAVLVSDASLPRLAGCLRSLLEQTLAPSRIIVLDATLSGGVAEGSRTRSGIPMDVVRVPRRAAPLPFILSRIARDITSEWIACISAEETLFPNHLFAAARAAGLYRARNGGAQPGLVHTGLVQASQNGVLPELMNDVYQVPRAEHIRLVQFSFGMDWNSEVASFPIHPSSCILHMPSIRTALRHLWGLQNPQSALTKRLRSFADRGNIAFTGAVTAATHDASQHPAFGRFILPH